MENTALTTAALAAFREAMPGEAVATVQTITQGWDSLALLVNGRWLLRVARRTAVGATLAREARLLPIIAEAVAPVHVPRFILTRFAEEPAVVGYEAIVGEPLSADSSLLVGEGPGVRSLAEQLANFLSKLHSIPTERAVAAGLAPTTAADWHAEYVAFAEWAQREVAPRLAPDMRAGLAHLWQVYLDAPDSGSFRPTVIHHDLVCEHILLTKNDALAGVIDWGDAALGDPAIDFAGILGELGEPFVRQVIEQWQGPRAADETTATVLARAVFYHRLGPLHAIRFGIITGATEYIENGLAALAK